MWSVWCAYGIYPGFSSTLCSPMRIESNDSLCTTRPHFQFEYGRTLWNRMCLNGSPWMVSDFQFVHARPVTLQDSTWMMDLIQGQDGIAIQSLPITDAALQGARVDFDRHLLLGLAIASFSHQ